MLKNIKLLIFFTLFFSAFWLFSQIALALDTVDLYLFHSESCPHCQEERFFLDSLDEEYGSQLKIHEYEIFTSDENRDLLKAVSDMYDHNFRGVPVTVVGDKIIEGFANAETTGQAIRQYINQCLSDGCEDKLGAYLESQSQEPVIKPDKKEIPEVINLPLFGQLKTKSVSLPILTFVIAAADGFNPCAMWVLMFLISLLLGMENRKRMWLLGSTFIVASGAVYFLFLAAWLNLFIFLGFILIVRLIIGLVAIISGGYNLREYWLNRPGCKVTRSQSRLRIFDKLKDITHRKSLLWALAGIIIIAFAVNLVELVCSAGLPAVFTQVLALTEMARWQYYLYLIFYIFIFMLDDMLVFVIAMVTLKSVGLSGKYSRFSNLVGGLIILILGILIIFKPGWLMFG